MRRPMPVVLRSEFERRQWPSAPPEQIETIQARVLPAEALAVVSDDEAAQYVGGYIKSRSVRQSSTN